MNFVYYFDKYFLILILTKLWFIRGTADFEFRELKYLSEKLDPIECFKLLDSVYGRIVVQEKSIQFEGHQREIQKILKKSWATQKSCFFYLQNWQDNFPGDRNIEGRKIMEDVLLSLRRPDLAKYLRNNQRGHFINNLKRFEKLVENNEDDEAKRYQLGNEEEMNKSKYPKGNGRTKIDRYNKFDLDENDSSNILPTVTNGESFDENNYENKNHRDVIKKKRRKKNFDVYWIILITVIALIIMSICGSGVFFIYRKNCDRFINGHICREWASNRKKQDINICCCGKRRETSKKACTDVDYMESGWPRRCSKCWLDPKGDNNEKSRLKQETMCVQKCKKLRKKKTHPKTKERFHKKEVKKVSRNKCLEKEMKTRKCQRSAISEPSRTDYKGMQSKIVTVPKNNYDYYQCNCTSEEAEFIIATKRDKKKKKSGWSSGWTSPQLKEKRIKESKNTEKLFQYDSSSPCSRKACEWRKIAKGKRHGKNSV